MGRAGEMVWVLPIGDRQLGIPVSAGRVRR